MARDFGDEGVDEEELPGDGEAGGGRAVGGDEGVAVGSGESGGEEVSDDAGFDDYVVAVFEGGDEAALGDGVSRWGNDWNGRGLRG